MQKHHQESEKSWLYSNRPEIWHKNSNSYPWFSISAFSSSFSHLTKNIRKFNMEHFYFIFSKNSQVNKAPVLFQKKNKNKTPKLTNGKSIFWVVEMEGTFSIFWNKILPIIVAILWKVIKLCFSMEEKKNLICTRPVSEINREAKNAYRSCHMMVSPGRY